MPAIVVSLQTKWTDLLTISKRTRPNSLPENKTPAYLIVLCHLGRVQPNFSNILPYFSFRSLKISVCYKKPVIWAIHLCCTRALAFNLMEYFSFEEAISFVFSMDSYKTKCFCKQRGNISFRQTMYGLKNYVNFNHSHVGSFCTVSVKARGSINTLKLPQF